jgi:glyoxylase-like metal-dependent hydrolase (beta-lactamase superfamily II)
VAAFVEIGEGTYLLPSGSNIGLIVRGGHAVIVDAGLDADGARRVNRAMASLGAKPVALLLTHAHADHFGGAGAIAERFAIPVYAPALEAAIVENPYLEPQFLFSGAAPVPELLGKFTLGAPCRVDRIVNAGALTLGDISICVKPLPGHAPNQVGYAFGATLFCGDSFFPEETLEKHAVLFCADVGKALETLARLPSMGYSHFAPGHGPVCQDVRDVCRANSDRLVAIAEHVLAACRRPQPTGALVKAVLDELGVSLAQVSQYCLAQTTVLACASWLRGQGRLEIAFLDNCMLWSAGSSSEPVSLDRSVLDNVK